MKIFKTGSSAVVVECQKQFNFLPLKFQVDIRTANLMTQFMSTDNFVCTLFVSQASRNLNNIFSTYGASVRSMRDLKTAVYGAAFNL